MLLKEVIQKKKAAFLAAKGEEMAGIYIHIPFCRSKCRYCDFTSYPGKIGFAEAYMACVYKEMKLRAEALKGKKIETVYFGGGTPSVIDARLILGSMRRIRECYDLAENAEITIEINPGTIDAESVRVYKDAGINRFSVGLQSANDAILEDIGRIHTAADFEKACDLLGDVNKSADIMIGLKGQKDSDIREAIELSERCGVKHISMYALTPEDGTPIYTDYLNGELPDSDEVASQYDFARKLLSEKGFVRYEVSNFAKKGFESRHNLNYWRRGEYIGFGVAASSFLKGRRFTNTRDLDDYIKCILSDHFPVVDDEKIEGEDAKFETVMLAFRTSEGLSLEDYRRVFGSDFASDFFDALKKHRERLELTNGRIRIKDEFLYVQNEILMDFLH